MKKFIAIICALLMILSVSTLFGCNKEDNVTPDNVTPHDISHYLAKTEVIQAKDKIKDGNTEKEIEAEYIDSEIKDNLVFYQYNIGTIKNCFIQTLTQPIFNDNGLKKIEYKTGTVTTDSVSKGLSNSVSTSKTVSVSDTSSKSFSWKIGVGSSKTVGVNFGIASASESFNIAAEIARTTTNTHSNAVSESIVNQTNESTDVKSIIENKQEITLEYNMADYEKGYYYALSFVADIDIYQIIVCDYETKQFITTYFLSNMGDGNTAIRMLSADSPAFVITPEYQLLPITEINIDGSTIVVSKPENIGDTTLFSGGFGTSEKPYLISNESQLVNIRHFSDKNFKIVSDFEVINTKGLLGYFNGFLDGGGYTLTFRGKRKVDFARIGDGQYGGLVDNNYGTIKNLTIKNMDLQSKENYHNDTFIIAMGAVVGINHENATIENVKVINGNFVCDRNNSAFGAVCGINNGNVSDCMVETTEIYATGNCGGIVGYSENGTVDSCQFAGKIGLYIANDNGGQTLRSWGGIVGFSTNSTISNCFVNSVEFNYHGENGIYHRYVMWWHSYCNMQICVGIICGTFDKSESGLYENCDFNEAECPLKLNLVAGDFHYGGYENEFLFAKMNGEIGKQK